MPTRVSIIGPPGSRVLVPVGKGGIRNQTKDSSFLIAESGLPIQLSEISDSGGGIIIA